MFAIANTLSNFSTKAKISSNSNYSSGASIGVDSISDQEKETEEELSGVEGVDGRLHYTIKHSLELLFRNKLYLPLHPFKTIIYNLLRDEASLRIDQKVVDYLSIPEEKPLPQNSKSIIKLVVYGATGSVGSKHLGRLFNNQSISDAKIVATAVRISLGDLPSSVTTEALNANFIEVIHANHCLNSNFAQPRRHKLTMTIEIIISGKTFDECLAIFIRRVLEETHNANTSPSVLTSSLRAISSGNDKSNSNNSDDNVQEIDLTSMKSKRFEILTILKSTIMNEGDICLEFLIKSTHKLPMYHEDSKTYLQETTGFINVKRFYKFSFKDDKNRTRCFHRYPYHSLALGVFNNMEEANTYLAAYTDHADRMRQAQKNSTDIAKKVAITTSGFYDVTANNIPTDEKNKVNLRVAYDILLNDTLILLSENAAKALENSDFVDATEQMLSIQVLTGWRHRFSSYCMNQLVYLTEGTIGHIRAVTDAICSIITTITLLTTRISTSAAVANHLQNISLSEEETVEMTMLTTIYNTVPDAIHEIKYLLIEFLRVEKGTELRYVTEYLRYILHLLFDKDNKVTPLIQPLEMLSKRNSLIDTTDILGECKIYLMNIYNNLKSIEVTISMNILSSLLYSDIQSYEIYLQSTKNNTLLITRSYADLPRNIMDLIGYVYSIRDKLLTWHPIKVSEYFRRQVLKNNNYNNFKKVYSENEAIVLEVADRMRLSIDPFAELLLSNSSRKSINLWDIFAVLEEYSIQRLGGIDFPGSVAEELERDEVPAFMAIEGAKMRYLNEVLIVSALQESYFLAGLAPHNSSHFEVTGRNLFRYPLLLKSSMQASRTMVADLLFQQARNNRIRFLNPAESSIFSNSNNNGNDKKRFKKGSGPSIVCPLATPKKLRKLLKGGVIASDRLLTAIGDADEVFRMIWNLPPLFNNTVSISNTNLHLKTLCGTSAATALFWGVPQFHEYQSSTEEISPQQGASIGAKTPYDNFSPKDLNSSDQGEKMAKLKLPSSRRKLHRFGTNALVEEIGKDDHHQEQRKVNNIERQDGGMNLIELEMVIKISYEHANGIHDVRLAFAKEVIRCCNYMIESPDWALKNMEVFKNVTSTGQSNCLDSKDSNGHTAKPKVFTECKISEERSQQSSKKIVESTVSKSAEVVLNTAALFPDFDGRLSIDEIMILFYRSIRKSPLDETAVNDNVDDIFKEMTGAPGINRESLAESDNEDYDVTHRDGFGYTFDDDADEDRLLDPTARDSDRICGNSFIAKLVQQKLQHKKAPKTYVPVRVRITLLAQYVPRNTFKGSAIKLGNKHLNNSVSAPTLGTAADISKPHFPEENFIGKQKNTLTIGHDQSIARLVANTVWFSSDSAKEIWSLVEDNDGEANAILHETTELWQSYHHRMQSFDYCGALRSSMVYAALSQQYELSTALSRCANCLAFKIQRSLLSLETCLMILDLHSNGSVNCTDLAGFGLTLSRHVCLTYKYLLSEPEAIHFRGSTCHIIALLQRLEKILGIGAIPLHLVLEDLPKHVLPRSISAKSVVARKTFDIPNIKANDLIYHHQHGLEAFEVQEGENNVSTLNNNNNNNQGRAQNATPAKMQQAPKVVDFADFPVSDNTANISIAKEKENGDLSDEGVLSFRTAIGVKKNVVDATAIVSEIIGMTNLLLFSYAKDCQDAFPEVDVFMNRLPSMNPSVECVELVLGDDGDFKSLDAYITRANSSTNSILELKEMPNLERLLTYRIGQSASKINGQWIVDNSSNQQQHAKSFTYLIKSIVAISKMHSLSKTGREQELIDTLAAQTKSDYIKQDQNNVSSAGLHLLEREKSISESKEDDSDLIKSGSVASLQSFKDKLSQESQSTGGRSNAISEYAKLLAFGKSFKEIKSSRASLGSIVEVIGTPNAKFAEFSIPISLEGITNSRTSLLLKQKNSGVRFSDTVDQQTSLAYQDDHDDVIAEFGKPDMASLSSGAGGFVRNRHLSDLNENNYEPQIVLTKFHTSGVQNVESVEVAPKAFSLVGNRAKKAAESSSMLQLLRAYNGIDTISSNSDSYYVNRGFLNNQNTGGLNAFKSLQCNSMQERHFTPLNRESNRDFSSFVSIKEGDSHGSDLNNHKTLRDKWQSPEIVDEEVELASNAIQRDYLKSFRNVSTNRSIVNSSSNNLLIDTSIRAVSSDMNSFGQNVDSFSRNNSFTVNKNNSDQPDESKEILQSLKDVYSVKSEDV